MQTNVGKSGNQTNVGESGNQTNVGESGNQTNVGESGNQTNMGTRLTSKYVMCFFQSPQSPQVGTPNI